MSEIWWEVDQDGKFVKDNDYMGPTWSECRTVYPRIFEPANGGAELRPDLLARLKEIRALEQEFGRYAYGEGPK